MKKAITVSMVKDDVLKKIYFSISREVKAIQLVTGERHPKKAKDVVLTSNKRSIQRRSSAIILAQINLIETIGYKKSQIPWVDKWAAKWVF